MLPYIIVWADLSASSAPNLKHQSGVSAFSECLIDMHVRVKVVIACKAARLQLDLFLSQLPCVGHNSKKWKR